MYKVYKENHDKYGLVIAISRDGDGSIPSPFWAVQKARTLKKELCVNNKSFKTKYFVDDQIMNISQLEKWSNEEYKELPKCAQCLTLLKGEVFTHSKCENNLFCTKLCADNNLKQLLDKFEEEEEEYECF